MKAFLLHLRTSPVRWMLLVLLPIDVAVLFLRPRFWIGIWPETGAAAQIVGGLTIPLLAGAAAWAGAAPSRHRLTEQLAAARVSPSMVEAQRLGAATVILLTPYLMAHAIAAILTARTDPPGLPLWAGYFGHGLFLSLFGIAFGWFVGRVYRSAFASLLAAAGALFATLLIGNGTTLLLTSGPVAQEVATASLLTRLAIVAAALAVLIYLPRRNGLRRSAMVGYGAAVTTLIVVLVTVPVIAPRTPPASVACTSNALTKLCVWPEHVKYLPVLQIMGDRIAGLPPLFTMPPEVNEQGLDPGYVRRFLHPEEIPDEEPYSFVILEGSPWSIAGDLANTAIAATLSFRDASSCGWNRLSPDDTARISSLYAWLESYIAGSDERDYKTNAPPDMQKAWDLGRGQLNLPKQQQFAWAGETLEQLRRRYCNAAS